jgi:hypothetical protein
VRYLFAVVAVITGSALIIYCTNTMVDPFWSRRTRVLGIIGAVIGIITIMIGIQSVTM